MKKLLLLPLLLGLPSPLFAGSSTSGYKVSVKCSAKNAGMETVTASVSLYKKENDNSKNWGVYTCASPSGECSWADKAVSYDTAVDKYNEKSSKLPCKTGTLSIDN